jgi:predicted nucleotidyltransferase
MKTTEEVLSLLANAKADLKLRFGVRRLSLFGSYARREQSKDSDVDILVEVDPGIGLRFVDLANEIESLLGIPTQVVSHRAIKSRNWKLIQPDLIDVP